MTRIDHLVITAGGVATRMGEAAQGLPKALIPVGGKPVLQHQLELAASCGVSTVTILAGHLGYQIVEFAGSGSRFGIDARTIVEDERLGNAGMLMRILDTLPENFLFLYGDIMLAADLGRLAAKHIERDAELTAVVHPNGHPFDSDLLETDAEGWVQAVHPCPHPDGYWFQNLVNAALYAVRRDVLCDYRRGGRIDFTRDVLMQLVAARRHVLAHRTTEYLKDMGTPARLQQVEHDWREGKIRRQDSALTPAVFLDRDGTLNVESGFLRRAEDLVLIPGAGDALRKLRDAGFRLVVLSNQPVIARGEASEADVRAIHHRLEWELGRDGAFLDAIYFCPHHPDRGFPGERRDLKFICECRKPATGMLDRACRELSLSRTGSWMIGDRSADMLMARNGGLRSILLKPENCDQKYPCAPDFEAGDIGGAAELIIAQQRLAAA